MKKCAAFLQIKQLHQEGEEAKRKKKDERMKRNTTKGQLKMHTELTRIIANLPETLEDLTSHCVLHPSSKVDFRKLGGIEKLIQFIDKSPSTFYRAHAAHTVAHVIDDDGRDRFGENQGIEALGRLLLVKEERCKEAACVAIEATVRGCVGNKKKIPTTMYEGLVDLIYGYPNQQVQEAACTALAAIVDNFADAKRILGPMNVVAKLLDTIRHAPGEVVHVTKAATTCVGRLAHGDPEMQALIAKLGGIDLLIDDVLFSPVGERDHQVPILASYALVNLCCSNGANMTIARKHPNYEEVRYRLMEGLARAFGNNTVREGFGRATAQETTSPFPYYGVTVLDKWASLTCGGRPIFSTFMENPQFYLYVASDTKLSLLIQDVLYEQRMQQKQRNNTVYMGLAVFLGDPELTKAGLKQLDFHGKMVEIAKFTSNCENVLHCTLKKSDTPYVIVPFTSQRGRTTDFALSAFGDQKCELTAVPEMTGWVRTIIDGCWTEFTGRSGENFDWRCNPQVRITAKENTRVVFVLSYLSLDQQRSAKRDEGEEERPNSRPRLHGRVFTSSFAPTKRYLKALVPLPQGSSFVASNTFSSNSYITTAANLSAGQSYVYVPFTELPFQDTWRLCVYSDTDDIEVAPVAKPEAEWNCCSFNGTWTGKPLNLSLKCSGPICIIATSKDTFLRISIADSQGAKLNGIDSFWNGEANVEHNVTTNGPVVIIVEGMTKTNGQQQLADGNKFDLCVFTEEPCAINEINFATKPCSYAIPTKATSQELLLYPTETPDTGLPSFGADVSEEESESADDDDGVSGGGGAGGGDPKALQDEVDRLEMENNRLTIQLKEQEDLIRQLRPGSMSTGYSSAPPSSGTPPSLGLQGKSMGSMRGRPVDSRQGANGGKRASTPTAAQPAPAPPQASRAEFEMSKAIDDVLPKLGSIAGCDRPPNGVEWTKIKKELKDMQTRLLTTRVQS